MLFWIAGLRIILQRIGRGASAHSQRYDDGRHEVPRLDEPRLSYATADGVPDVCGILRDGRRPVEIRIVWFLRSSSSWNSRLEGSPPFSTSIRYFVRP